MLCIMEAFDIKIFATDSYLREKVLSRPHPNSPRLVVFPILEGLSDNSIQFRRSLQVIPRWVEDNTGSDRTPVCSYQFTLVSCCRGHADEIET